MGGWASIAAAATFPAQYQSMVLVGSSTGTLGLPEGTNNFPRNLGIIYSKFDEFYGLMWGTDTATGIGETSKLKKLFNTTDTVTEKQIYGSIANGTARQLFQPLNTHAGDHFSTEVIGDAIEWFEKTLVGGKKMPRDNQIWYWKQLGNFVAVFGMILLILDVSCILLALRFFSELDGRPKPTGEFSIVGSQRW